MGSYRAGRGGKEKKAPQAGGTSRPFWGEERKRRGKGQVSEKGKDLIRIIETNMIEYRNMIERYAKIGENKSIDPEQIQMSMQKDMAPLL